MRCPSPRPSGLGWPPPPSLAMISEISGEITKGRRGHIVVTDVSSQTTEVKEHIVASDVTAAGPQGSNHLIAPTPPAAPPATGPRAPPAAPRPLRPREAEV
eukprot:12015888-Heterocapsa_arctica.AAC.1